MSTRGQGRTVPPWVTRPGRGLLVAVVLLCVVEAWLHTDIFLLKFRSVFAAGRAMDKVVYAETHRPGLLILGNSRADNGFDPRTVQRAYDADSVRSAFNLGLPGADTRVLAGIVDRLDRNGSFAPAASGRSCFRSTRAWCRPSTPLARRSSSPGPRRSGPKASTRMPARRVPAVRLCRQPASAREPAVLQRFIRALHEDVEPVGGGATRHLGYRAGFGGLQDVQAARLQEVGSLAPPSDANLRQLWRMLDLLAARGVRVAIVFPPLLQREVLYRAPQRAEAAPYVAIATELQRRGIPLIALDAGPRATRPNSSTPGT